MLHACTTNNVPCMLCSIPGPFQLLPEHTVNSEGMQCTVEHCTSTFGLRLQSQAVSGIAACLIGLVPVPFAIAFILKYVPLLCTCPSCHWLPTPSPAYTPRPPLPPTHTHHDSPIRQGQVETCTKHSPCRQDNLRQDDSNDSCLLRCCREMDVSAAEIEAVLPLLKKVPYSLHCSFHELESFVAHLRPHAIVPVVKKSYDSRFPIDPNRHFKHLLGSPQPCTHPFQYPRHVQQEKRRKMYAVRQKVAAIGETHKMTWQVSLDDSFFLCALAYSCKKQPEVQQHKYKYNSTAHTSIQACMGFSMMHICRLCVACTQQVPD